MKNSNKTREILLLTVGVTVAIFTAVAVKYMAILHGTATKRFIQIPYCTIVCEP